MTDRAKIDFIKNYELTLTTKAPVHIGCGESYTGKDYFIKNNRLYIVDVGKMYQNADPQQTERLDKFFSNPHQKLDGSNFASASSAIKYELDLPSIVGAKTVSRAYGSKVRRQSDIKINDIAAFIKDAYGHPYIPGSSMKGALLMQLYKEAIAIAVDREDAAEMQQAYPGILDEIESYKKRAVVSKGTRAAISIADSQEHKLETLTLCQKIDSTIDNRGRENEWGLPIFRECLKPGLEVRFRMNIDTNKLGDHKSLPIDILAHLVATAQELELYVGGGTGFLTKTMPQDVREIQKQFTHRRYEKHHHEKDLSFYGKVPRCDKYTKYEGQLMLMGCCSLKIREV